jgi:nucleoid-associated protein YgaU
MRHGEQLVSVGDNGTTPRPQPVPMGQMREYKAQSGDSLSKLAARFMGSSSKANREAIVRVNPTLQQNPDKIVEGRTYVIPPAPTADAATAAPAQPQTQAPAPTPVVVRDNAPAPAPITTTGGENFTWYTVKENENLWKIASEQLGSGNAWTQIRDLNADILKGNDQLRVNTRIRIPNKPVASAAH